jgi:pimeloyl-ACP methyl ester carboxylesterase
MRRIVSTVAVLILLLATLLAAGFVWTRFAVARIEAAHPPVGQFVPVTGGRLHLVDRGPRDAPPEKTLVMVHGASGNVLDHLLAFEDRLPADWRRVYVDRPGHGWSGRPGGRASASAGRQAALIMEALAVLGIRRSLVLGHSLAGAHTTAMAMDYPDRVAGLMLIAPATHPWPGGIAAWYTLAGHPVIGPLFNHTLMLPIASLIMPASIRAVFHPQAAPTGYADKAGIRLILRPQVFQANAEDVSVHFQHVTERAPRYPELKMPVAIVTGGWDLTVYPSIHTLGLERQLPDVEVELLEGVGHMPHQTHGDVVMRHLLRLSERAAARIAAVR